MAPLLPISAPQPSQPLTNHTRPITVSRFYDFANSQKTSKLPINSPIKAYHQPITNLSPAYSLPTALFPQRPPFPHSNFDALHNPTILHWHLFSPTAPQPSQPLTNHTHHFTVTRFYDFANSQKTSKLPINRPIKAYHQPIHCQQPFSPNALHSPIPILTHCTIQPLRLHWYLFSPTAPQPSRLLTNHTPYYSFTFLRFCKFTENNKTSDKQPH